MSDPRERSPLGGADPAKPGGGAAMSDVDTSSKHVSLVSALQSRRAIVCAGAGGVGKTTVSASLALAAARLGRRVLVVTIDPSRRLAETLGVSRHLPEPVALDPARLAALGVHPPGSLDAWMLDPGIVSDRTVESFAQTPDDARRLLANPVYQGLSRMTAGMQEFTAVEAMHTFVTTGRYDLVVLDTPPARNALRFLDAPRRVSAFMDRRIFEAFAPTTAGSGLVRRLAGSVVEKVLDVALGQNTRKAVQEFFALFGALLQHLETNQQTMVRFLRSDAVGFVLVTSPHRAAVDEALALEARCRAILGVPLLGRVLNQSLAADDDAAPHPAASLFGDEDAATVAAALPVLTRLAEAEQAEITAHRETAVRLERESGTTWVLPRLPVAASNLEALNALVERVLKA